MIYRKREKPDEQHPLLLAFAGKTKSGKTTSAEHIRNKYGGEVFAFADSLKSQLYDLNAIRGSELAPFLAYAKEQGKEIDFHSFPKPNLNNPSRPEKIAWINRHKETFGNLLQTYGDYKRKDNPNYFIERTLLAIEKARNDGDFVLCVDDVRYAAEADALTDIGFEIIRVQAGDDERTARGASRDPLHSSEVEMDNYPFCFTVFNNAEPFSLYSQIDTVVEQIINQ